MRSFALVDFSINIAQSYHCGYGIIQRLCTSSACLHYPVLRITPTIYETILDQNISSFLKFVAHRYDANPVRKAITIPESEPCPSCKRGMTNNHQTIGNPVRVLWHCNPCNQTFWHTYATEISQRTKSTMALTDRKLLRTLPMARTISDPTS